MNKKKRKFSKGRGKYTREYKRTNERTNACIQDRGKDDCNNEGETRDCIHEKEMGTEINVCCNEEKKGSDKGGEKVKNWPTIVVASLTLISFLWGVYEFRLNNVLQKKAATIEHLKTLHEILCNTDESLLKIINLYDQENIDNSISCDSLAIILRNNLNYRRQLDEIMTGFNRLAIGCQEGFYDEETVWSADCRTVVNVTKALLPYFELIEKETGRVGDNHVCCFLRLMVVKWEQDTKMSGKYDTMISQYYKSIIETINDSIEIGRKTTASRIY